MGSNEVKIKVNPKIGIGLGTIAGIGLSVFQYLGALALILAGDMTEESIGAMLTATLTLYKTLDGRFKQADSAIKAIGRETPAEAAVVTTVAGEPETNVLYLDGHQIANAVVKSLNTDALISNMRIQTPAPVAAAETSGNTPIPGES